MKMIHSILKIIWQSPKQVLGFFRFLVSKPVIITGLIVLQLYVLIRAMISIGSHFTYAYAFFIVLSYIVTLRLLNSTVNPAFKLALIIPIMVFPVFGGPFYLLFGSDRVGRRESKIFNKAWQMVSPLLVQNQETLKKLEDYDRQLTGQVNCITEASAFPIYDNTDCSFIASGDIYFDELLTALEKAEYFIFMEFFIISQGQIWTKILDILERKAAAGLDVRVIYDDLGCISHLPQNYDRVLRKKGIKCSVFNPYRPTLSLTFNHRDHRKIVVIDGYIGFTGGINVSDGYADSYSGVDDKWCDTALQIRGEAVWNLTVMFMQAWCVDNPEEDFEQFRPHVHHPNDFAGEGFLLPFGDSPFDDQQVAEMAYLNIINQAIDSIVITTPYLVIGYEIVSALITAAKRGVRIRIVVPSAVENWLIHLVTEAHYSQLIAGGVEVYSYTPGSIHGKNLLCDGKIGIVGTINLDFRSLYHNFECAIWLYGQKAVQDLNIFLEEELSKSTSISYEESMGKPWYLKVVQSFARTLAPLL